MDEEKELHELARLFRRFIGTVMKQSMADMLRVMRREELSMPQMVSLFYLRRHGAASISDIRDQLNLSLAATSHLIDRLVIAGLVTRAEDLMDRRQKRVTLTTTGSAIVDEVEHTRLALLVERLEEMPSPEIGQTVATLENVLRYLDDPDAACPPIPEAERERPFDPGVKPIT